MKHLPMIVLTALALVVPALADDASDYPLRLQIASVEERVLDANGGVYLAGKGTLSSQIMGPVSAVEYSGTCSFSFNAAPTAAHILIWARWKKEPIKLQLIFRRGSDPSKRDRCDVQIGNTVPGQAYVTTATGVQLVGSRVYWSALAFARGSTQLASRDVDKSPAMDRECFEACNLRPTTEEYNVCMSGCGRGRPPEPPSIVPSATPAPTVNIFAQCVQACHPQQTKETHDACMSGCMGRPR